MASDAKRQQKKREQKAAKRKARIKAKTSKPQGTASRVAIAAKHPIHECLVSDALHDAGIGSAILSRVLPNGQIATSVFLIDIHCLGVKDAMFRIVESDEYTELVDSLGHHGFSPTSPECLRRLVEGAVAYAGDIGLMPHDDYQTAAILFGAIDAQQCSEEYEYGYEGKPLFTSGPGDSPARVQQILTHLQRHLGDDGFMYELLEEDWLNEETTDYEADHEAWIALGVTSEPIIDMAFGTLPEEVKKQSEILYHAITETPEETIPELESLVERYPTIPNFTNYLHAAYLSINDQSGVERMISLMRERFPDYLFGLLAEAQHSLQNGNLQRVAELLGKASTLQELYPERDIFHISEALGFYMIKGWHSHEIGETEHAKSYYEIMVALDPNDVRTHSLERLIFADMIRQHMQEFLSRMKP